ncbi:MAG: galactokinase [Promethearchaeota archaeon]
MSFSTSAPGRLCLFGEHQDYLGFPVVTLAVDRRVRVDVVPTGDHVVQVSTPDVGGCRKIDLREDPVPRSHDRDYLAGAVNVLRREGVELGRTAGFDATVTGSVPINAGMSSSSALVVAWLHALLTRAGRSVEPGELARLGYLTEVVEFGEAGGMMDHFSAALGGLLFLETSPSFVPRPLPVPDDRVTFVVGNSEEKKSTVDDLRRVKSAAQAGFEALADAMAEVDEKFDPKATPFEVAEAFVERVPARLRPFVLGNLANRDLTRAATRLLERRPVAWPRVGALLNQHHAVLRDSLGVSTAKIEATLRAAKQSGALGGKINGSGFGGTCFVVVPNEPEKVVAVREAMESEGCDAFVVAPSGGSVVVSYGDRGSGSPAST